MADQSPIWECARRDLVLIDPDGNQDVFLWEHSQRVAQNARHIAALPGVPVRRIDATALEAAALYHDAAWACQFRAGTVGRFEILGKPASDAQRALSAARLTEALAGRLKPRILETAGDLVRQLNDPHIEAVEVQILSDADNLDEIGSLALWNLVRRHTWEGKGVEAALKTWERQREFRFWEARINKSLRFEAVKQIACQRLKLLDQFMDLLARHHAGDDFLELAKRVPQRTR
ncbi:MAG: HD domain-containing protein [Planctomycetota bacterium]